MDIPSHLVANWHRQSSVIARPEVTSAKLRMDQDHGQFNLARIGVILSANSSGLVVAQVNCPEKSIVDFISSSPIGMRKGPITNTAPSQ